MSSNRSTFSCVSLQVFIPFRHLLYSRLWLPTQFPSLILFCSYLFGTRQSPCFSLYAISSFKRFFHCSSYLFPMFWYMLSWKWKAGFCNSYCLHFKIWCECLCTTTLPNNDNFFAGTSFVLVCTTTTCCVLVQRGIPVSFLRLENQFWLNTEHRGYWILYVDFYSTYETRNWHDSVMKKWFGIVFGYFP